MPKRTTIKTRTGRQRCLAPLSIQSHIRVHSTPIHRSAVTGTVSTPPRRTLPTATQRRCSRLHFVSFPASRLDTRQKANRGWLNDRRLAVNGGGSTSVKVQSCLVAVIVTSAPPIFFSTPSGTYTFGFIEIQPNVRHFPCDVWTKHHGQVGWGPRFSS